MHLSQLVVLHRLEMEALAAVFPNPRCRPWCTTAHEISEFVSTEGMLVCLRTFGQGPTWGVYVEQVQLVDRAQTLLHTEAEEFLAGPVDMWAPVVRFDADMEVLHLGELPAFSAAVVAAAAFCEGIGDDVAPARLGVVR